jgi:hypothetical protein
MLLLALLLTCLSISLLLNLFLYERAVTYYRQLNDTRLDPLGLQVYQTDLQTMPIQSTEKTQVVNQKPGFSLEQCLPTCSKSLASPENVDCSDIEGYHIKHGPNCDQFC